MTEQGIADQNESEGRRKTQQIHGSCQRTEKTTEHGRDCATKSSWNPLNSFQKHEKEIGWIRD